jgi:hypothetical protein
MDIYELKAQKYKYKYFKLKQELVGGTYVRTRESSPEGIRTSTPSIDYNLLGYQLYSEEQKQKPGQLPVQTYDDYLRTIREYEEYIVAQSQALTQAQVPIPSYTYYMQMLFNMQNGPIIQRQLEQRKQFRIELANRVRHANKTQGA